MIAKSLIGLLAGLAMMGLSTGAHAGSDLDAAIEAGAKRLSADEIAERLTGQDRDLRLRHDRPQVPYLLWRRQPDDGQESRR
jgi:hypothetical protein